MPAVIDTDKVGQDGQVIHPVLGNTLGDGSGSTSVAQMDKYGHQLIDETEAENTLIALQQIVFELRELKKILIAL